MSKKLADPGHTVNQGSSVVEQGVRAKDKFIKETKLTLPEWFDLMKRAEGPPGKAGRPKGENIKPEHRDAWLNMLVEAQAIHEQGAGLRAWCKKHKHKWPDGLAHGESTVRAWLKTHAQEIKEMRNKSQTTINCAT